MTGGGPFTPSSSEGDRLAGVPEGRCDDPCVFKRGTEDGRRWIRVWRGRGTGPPGCVTSGRMGVS